MRMFLPLALAACSACPVFPQTINGSAPSGGLPACAVKALRAAGFRRPASPFSDSLIHVTYYKLDLSIVPSPPFLSGMVTVKALSLSDSLTSVTLDLAGAMTVDSVRSGTARLQVARFLKGIGIQLDREYHRGEMVVLDIYYRGVPVPTGDGSFEFSSTSNAPLIWSLSEPYGAPDWWPCKDDNADKADSVDVWVTVPSGLRVGSNGVLVAVRDNGDGTSTHQWSERYPIAAYLVSVAVSDYAQYTGWFRYSPSDSMPIVNYVLPEHLASARATLDETKDMLRIFSDAYGLYPFIGEKYGHSEFGWGGAMEHQTMTSTGNFAESTIAHELAHQWFGDMICCANWPNLWLNEGFAVFSESVFLERYYGASAYRAHIDYYMPYAMEAQGSLYVQDTTTVAGLFNFNRVYAKGAWTLHMLRHVLGDSVFFRSMRAYAADPRFRFKSATTEGFRSVCEAVAGKDLGYFFTEWVYGEGYPRYQYNWSSAPAVRGFDVTLVVAQSGTSGATPFFTMPVDIRIVSGSWDTTVSVLHTASGQRFAFNVPFRPTDVTVDPDDWILRDVVPPSAVLPESYALAQNYPNPFNPGTTISFSLPHRTALTLAVYDALGRQVAVIAGGRFEAGDHSVRWEGTDAGGHPVSSGVYFYRLTTDTFTAARRMLLLR